MWPLKKSRFIILRFCEKKIIDAVASLNHPVPTSVSHGSNSIQLNIAIPLLSARIQDEMGYIYQMHRSYTLAAGGPLESEC